MDRDEGKFAPALPLGRGFLLAAGIAAGVLAAAPVQAQRAAQVAAATIVPATVSATADLPAPAGPACTVAATEARLDYRLARTGRRLAAGKPVKIVAIGSSSTAGAGASSPAASYPSRLAVELRRLFPGQDISVINRGVNGDEMTEMLARFESNVIAERPDLVIWQLGTNSVLRDRPLDPRAVVLHQGLARLKEIRADVVLVDPQFAPRVNAKPGIEAMVDQIAATAKEQSIGLFHRYAVMRHWQEVDHLSFETFVSPDGLHMNDWSYACFAKWLATSIAEAATRPTATAGTTATHAAH